MTRALRILALALLLASCGAAPSFAWSFAVCGDSRNDVHGVFPRILADVAASDMEFLVHTGDLENTGGVKPWTAFRSRMKGFAKPVWLVIGNHELYGDGTREGFLSFFGLSSASYAFTHRNARFAVVDDASGSLPDATLQWLDGDLAAHPKGRNGIDFIVVALHVPPRTEEIFPHGTSGDFGDQSKKLLAILTRHKADLVVAGHEHMQSVEAWNGIKVIVSGGAGAPMIPFHRFGYYRVDLGRGGVRETFVPVGGRTLRKE